MLVHSLPVKGKPFSCHIPRHLPALQVVALKDAGLMVAGPAPKDVGQGHVVKWTALLAARVMVALKVVDQGRVILGQKDVDQGQVIADPKGVAQMDEDRGLAMKPAAHPVVHGKVALVKVAQERVARKCDVPSDPVHPPQNCSNRSNFCEKKLLN